VKLPVFFRDLFLVDPPLAAIVSAVMWQRSVPSAGGLGGGRTVEEVLVIM
jgi:hypothetical protein